MTGWTFNTPDDTPTNGPQLAAVCIAFTAVALFLVCLRLYVRTTLVKAVGYAGGYKIGTIIVAVACTMGHIAFICVFIFLCTPVEKQYDPSIPADIQMRKKIVLLALFILGVFVTIIQAIRIQTIKNLVNYLDSAKSIQWSVIENCIGVVIACVPTLAPMVKYFAEKSRNYNDSDSRPKNSRYALQTWGTKRSGMQPLGTGIDREVSVTGTTKAEDSTENILSQSGITKRTDLQITTHDAPETWSNNERKQDV
ncbi:uncharacterized protein ColSpa_00625 [Colletotrichum spaethianum]|uniref:Rhodopsin domain-containing protein n=1 Tax=Colletotrichum spaethianum TaxID=700344 RepID=A0AA37P6T3_9PEZI|nr:uncharacterized protein ColSpa_00625 [Colletotrichum spaethianum]GKT40444.1 hypothetical protein ColSpa_00625 [Colletotrichum spaethianum]